MTNAILIRLTNPSAPSVGGDVTYTPGEAIGVRVAMDLPTMAQRRSLDALIKSATSAMYVRKNSLPEGVVPTTGQQAQVQIDGDAAAGLYIVEHVINRQKVGGLAHWECFLRKQ